MWAPCAPPSLTLQPRHLFLRHLMLLSSCRVPGTVLSARDTKMNISSCQGANNRSSLLPDHPHPTPTAHVMYSALESQSIAGSTWHLLGSHLRALHLCNFSSSPGIHLSLSFTLADTYLASKTPFWHCLHQEAFCSVPRLGEMPPHRCSPHAPI